MYIAKGPASFSRFFLPMLKTEARSRARLQQSRTQKAPAGWLGLFVFGPATYLFICLRAGVGYLAVGDELAVVDTGGQRFAIQSYVAAAAINTARASASAWITTATVSDETLSVAVKVT
jgi:hypothetical protein